jgi:hypothetical protein
MAKMTFSSTSQNILDVVANRTITLAQTGSIQVTDFYNMTNRGHDLSSIALPVPKNVPSAIASDIIPSVVSLSSSTALDGTTVVTFVPRFGTLKAGGSSSTRITYSLPTQSYLTSKGLGRFELSFRLLDNVKFFEPVLQVKIVTPMGFHLNSLTGQTFTISGNQILRGHCSRCRRNRDRWRIHLRRPFRTYWKVRGTVRRKISNATGGGKDGRRSHKRSP